MDPANISETDWVEYFDDNTQQPYYINKLTRHSQYECPQEYEDWKQNEIEKYLKTTNWRRRKDEKRKAYFYFNKLTNSTQWEIPSEEEEFVEFLKNVNIDRTDWGSGSEDDENDVEDRKEKRRDSSGRGYDQEEGDELEFHQDYYSDEEEHNDVSITRNFDDSFVEDGELLEEDSKLKELEFLESKLSAKDSIMEPTINQTIHKYLRVAPDATPGDIVTKLSTNYVGYAQLTHIICHWITLIQRNFDEEAFIAKEMGLLIKRKFNKV